MRRPEPRERREENDDAASSVDDQVDELGLESFPASDPPQGPARIWSGAGKRDDEDDSNR